MLNESLRSALALVQTCKSSPLPIRHGNITRFRHALAVSVDMQCRVTRHRERGNTLWTTNQLYHQHCLKRGEPTKPPSQLLQLLTGDRLEPVLIFGGAGARQIGRYPPTFVAAGSLEHHCPTGLPVHSPSRR